MKSWNWNFSLAIFLTETSEKATSWESDTDGVSQISFCGASTKSPQALNHQAHHRIMWMCLKTTSCNKSNKSSGFLLECIRVKTNRHKVIFSQSPTFERSHFVTQESAPSKVSNVVTSVEHRRSNARGPSFLAYDTWDILLICESCADSERLSCDHIVQQCSVIRTMICRCKDANYQLLGGSSHFISD